MHKSVTKIVAQRNPPIDQTISTFSTEIPHLLKRIYLNRGITHENQIKTHLSALFPFHELLNIQQSSALLSEGITFQKRFLIVGDFDTDGATSTALAVKALKLLGAKFVNYLIPNRFEFGYGLTPEIVEVAAKEKPDILITVDNGISSHQGVIRAKQYGMKVLITDHHLPGDTLPEADVIINPNQHGDQFPSKNLAGVGVIFYVMLALRDYLNAKHINMAQFLDLVALGTVADVVMLDHNNRILVYQGLKRIRKELCSKGILSLLQASRRKISETTTSDLGFFVAPRLNAAGRLEDMSLGVACLLSEESDEAKQCAHQLDHLNNERREIQNDMIFQAEKLLQSFSVENNTSGLCLYHSDFHQGVIGILAGKLKDYYHRPVIVFSKVENGELKGSGRSIPGLHLRDLLAFIDTKYPNLILKFGGHAMAAGLSIAEKDFDKFSEIFHSSLMQNLQPELLKNILLTDGELTSDEFTLASAQILQDHLTWGQGFPEPLFEGEFYLLDQNLIQQKHLKLRLQPCKVGEKTAQKSLEAIAFNYGSHIPVQIQKDKVRLVYRLSTNEYQGLKKLQLIVEYIQ